MFSTSSHGEVRGGPGPSEGTFFTFFSGSVRASNRFPAWPPGEGDRGSGSRSVTSTSASIANGFARPLFVPHREHRGHSLTFGTHRVHLRSASTIACAVSIGHKVHHRYDPIAARTSHDLLTIFDRSERSRTSFDARGKFSASSIDPSSTSHSSPTSQARTRSLARSS